jgi:dolichyl-phosphate-mannose--protein O-mannosyl transferase
MNKRVLGRLYTVPFEIAMILMVSYGLSKFVTYALNQPLMTTIGHFLMWLSIAVAFFMLFTLFVYGIALMNLPPDKQ